MKTMCVPIITTMALWQLIHFGTLLEITFLVFVEFHSCYAFLCYLLTSILLSLLAV